MSPEVVDRLWEKSQPLYISKEEFAQDLSRWVIREYRIDGELSFVTLINGPEFHYASLGTGHPISGAQIKDALQPIIDAYGFVTTRTAKEDVRQQRLNLLIGFIKSGEDEFFIHYRAARLRLNRGSECLS